MKESLWGYWLIVLSIGILSVMIVLQSYSTTNEQDYFLVKSALESSMKEAVDFGYYTDINADGSNSSHGVLKMNREKFVENFIRRFAETVNINKDYTINFYDIYEVPPCASVSVVSATSQSNFGQSQGATSSVDSTNKLTGILYTTSDYKE